MLVEIAPEQLALVAGGEGADDNAFGRCGPGTRWAWLGNVYTPECRAHDAAVRGAIDNGSSRFMAHVRALPLLRPAVSSYLRARIAGQ